MGATFSSTVTSYRQLAKSRLSFNCFNNTTARPLNQQPLPVLAPAEPATPIDIIIVPGPPEIQLVNATTTISGSAAGDNRAQDNSERIAEQVQPILIAVAAAVVAGPFALLANPLRPVHNLIIYKIYLIFHLLSVVLSTVSLFYIRETTPSLGVAWLQKQAMKIAIVSTVISVTVRIFLLLPTPIEWYDVLVPLLLVGAISLYLWYGWIKANNSRQISSHALTSSYTNEV